MWKIEWKDWRGRISKILARHDYLAIDTDEQLKQMMFAVTTLWSMPRFAIARVAIAINQDKSSTKKVVSRTRVHLTKVFLFRQWFPMHLIDHHHRSAVLKISLKAQAHESLMMSCTDEKSFSHKRKFYWAEIGTLKYASETALLLPPFSRTLCWNSFFVQKFRNQKNDIDMVSTCAQCRLDPTSDLSELFKVTCIVQYMSNDFINLT